MNNYRSPLGWFVMQEVGSQNVKDDKLVHPKVAGLVLRERWSKLEPKLGATNDYSFLEQQLGRCDRAKRKVILSIYTGSNAPTWVNPKRRFGPSGLTAPFPFDDATCDAYCEMIEALGQRYGSDPTIVGVEIGGPTCPDMSIEMHYTSGLERQAGYSEQKMIDAWMTCGDAVALAFPDCAIISDGGPAPGGTRGARVTTPVWEHWRSKWGKRFYGTHCALKANTSTTALHHKLVTDQRKAGGSTGFEAACGMVDAKGRPIARFGGDWKKAQQIAAAAGAEFIKFYQWDVNVLPDWV